MYSLQQRTILVICAVALMGGIFSWRTLRLWKPKPSLLDRPAVFFILAASLLFVFRWPSIVATHEFNPDESQMIAQGMRFLQHPMPWRDVDGGSGGPLLSLVLSAPIKFGAPPTWETARIVRWFIDCSTLIFLYLAMRCFGGRSEAQFALLPTVFFYAFSFEPDFLQYSSEALPNCLLAGCFCFLARAWKSIGSPKANFFFLGFLLGAVPFAKLQCSPLVVFLFLTGASIIVFGFKNTAASSTGFFKVTGIFGLGLLISAVPHFCSAARVRGARRFLDFLYQFRQSLRGHRDI